MGDYVRNSLGSLQGGMTEVMRMDHHSALTRIRVLDQGNEDRLMAVVMNSVDISDE